MAVLGLLLATIGTDVSTGTERFTLGLEQLAEGLIFSVMVLGLIVVADALICVVSPSLWLAIYAREIAGRIGRQAPTIARLGLRLVAVLAIAAACFYAFELNRAIGDVGVLVAFGLFGIACKVLGWNRPMLLFGAYYGAIIETNISRALMLSNGDPAVFLRRPISATLLLLAIAILTLVTTCSVWRGPSKISPKGT